MIWEPELEELRRREGLARRMGGEERVARQHASGRLTVRERIDRLFDDGSFHETGALAGRAVYGDDGELTDFVPANTVLGQGQIDGRRAAVQGDDFTVRGGAADVAIWEKAVYAERLAHDLRIPLVRLVDGTGGGGSMKTLEQMGFSYVPPLPGFDLVVENQSVVPVLAAAFGETPDKEELGGARLQARAWRSTIVPRDPRRPYKMRRILEHVLDRGSVFELGAAFGRPTITCLARLGGRPVGGARVGS
jgi:acetyl-CoA carboxylase carboxyltransferase component